MRTSRSGKSGFIVQPTRVVSSCTQQEWFHHAPNKSGFIMHPTRVVSSCTQQEWFHHAPNMSGFIMHPTRVVSSCTQQEWFHHAPNKSGFIMHPTRVVSSCTQQEWFHHAPNKSGFIMHPTRVVSSCTQQEWFHHAPNKSGFIMHPTRVVSSCTQHEWFHHAPNMSGFIKHLPRGYLVVTKVVSSCISEHACICSYHWDGYLKIFTDGDKYQKIDLEEKVWQGLVCRWKEKIKAGNEGWQNLVNITRTLNSGSTYYMMATRYWRCITSLCDVKQQLHDSPVQQNWPSWCTQSSVVPPVVITSALLHTHTTHSHTYTHPLNTHVSHALSHILIPTHGAHTLSHTHTQHKHTCIVVATAPSIVLSLVITAPIVTREICVDYAACRKPHLPCSVTLCRTWSRIVF